ncbi:MAG: polysaccharide pyruvyl transferase family protein [Crocosphaera sp.]|nr:polysaccharide pyruvyl transferase family protein [Crocosphaera sp.]
MKILIEQSHYELVNMGDLSMLEVVVSRLKKMWPEATVTIFTFERSRDVLQQYCPGTIPLESLGQNIWFTTRLSDQMLTLMNKFSASKFLDLIEWRLRCQFPGFSRRIMKKKFEKQKWFQKNEEMDYFFDAVAQADLVIASGGGYITDAFYKKATTALGIVGMAKALGKPTVMLGQGIGPLKNPQLRTRAKMVLPKVDLITLREKKLGLPLLGKLGVSSHRIIATGDDAVELVYNNRSSQMGEGIGINLRIAKYSKVGPKALETTRITLQQYAQEKNVPLIPVPIEFLDSNSDVQSIKQLMAGYDDTSDGGQSLKTPIQVIKQVGRCRVVVTGSYHGGVFALSQGIPVIGLAKSNYYENKFLGLADQFKTGCQLLSLGDPDIKNKLTEAIDKAWSLSEQWKPDLLEAAKQQIDQGHTAYQQIYKLVESQRNNKFKS